VSNFRWGLIFGSFALVISVSLGIFSGVNPLHIFLRALFFTFIFFGLGTGIRFVINSFFPELLFVDEETGRHGSAEHAGSLVDITLGIGEYAVPEAYKDEDNQQAHGSSGNLGNIEDLISGSYNTSGIDRKSKEAYNNSGGQITGSGINDSSSGFSIPEAAGFFAFQGEQSPSTANVPSSGVTSKDFSPSFGDDEGGLGGLPDLDIMARAFSPGFAEEQAHHPNPAQSASSMLFATDIPASDYTNSFEEAPVRYNKGNKPQQLQGDFNPKELAQGLRTILSKDK
jgi:hypothetical protein